MFMKVPVFLQCGAHSAKRSIAIISHPSIC